MPKPLTRALLALLVALAVPVQAIAASGAELCQALGHHDHPGTHDAALAHGGEASHEHDGHGSQDSHDAHCPPCASCCAVAAIAPFSPSFAPERPAHATAVAVLPRYAGIVPRSLDRPPLAL